MLVSHLPGLCWHHRWQSRECEIFFFKPVVKRIDPSSSQFWSTQFASTVKIKNKTEIHPQGWSPQKNSLMFWQVVSWVLQEYALKLRQSLFENWNHITFFFISEPFLSYMWGLRYIRKGQEKYGKYQPSSARGTHSPPATLHRLQNPKWPLGGPQNG